jgi:hypothetical protein
MTIHKSYLGFGRWASVTDLGTQGRQIVRNRALFHMDNPKMPKPDTWQHERAASAVAGRLHKIKTTPSLIKNIHYGASVSSAQKRMLEEQLKGASPPRGKVVIHTRQPTLRSRSGRRNKIANQVGQRAAQLGENQAYVADAAENTVAYALAGGRKRTSHIIITQPEQFAREPGIIHHELAHVNIRRAGRSRPVYAAQKEEARANWVAGQHRQKGVAQVYEKYPTSGYTKMRGQLAKVPTRRRNPFAPAELKVGPSPYAQSYKSRSNLQKSRAGYLRRVTWRS